MITQNLVQGTGAPGPQQRDEQREPAQGRRHPARRRRRRQLVRHAHQHRRQRVRRRSTRPADDTADGANPLKAENNWWGLCSPVGTNRCNGEPLEHQPPNNGPAISPATNPPLPGEPGQRRGRRHGDGSTTVDFLPFRNGPQSDPNTGQFPVVPAPIPVNDAAPAVTVAAASARPTAAARPSC